jgi:hypothetical protein
MTDIAVAETAYVNVVFLEKLLPKHKLVVWSLPVHIVDFFGRTEILLRVAMAVKTPAHKQPFGLPDNFHLVDLAVTLGTTDTVVYMNIVVEVDKVG